MYIINIHYENVNVVAVLSKFSIYDVVDAVKIASSDIFSVTLHVSSFALLLSVLQDCDLDIVSSFNFYKDGN